MTLKRERVVLETKEGTARDIKQLREVWEHRIQEYFPHYKIVRLKIFGRKRKLIK